VVQKEGRGPDLSIGILLGSSGGVPKNREPRPICNGFLRKEKLDNGLLRRALKLVLLR